MCINENCMPMTLFVLIFLRLKNIDVETFLNLHMQRVLFYFIFVTSACPVNLIYAVTLHRVTNYVDC